MQRLLEKIREILRNRRTRMFFTRFVSLVAAIVVFITTYALVLPAITLEKTASCGIEEHQHSDDCYEDVLTCGQEESEGHHHDDSCYTITKELECQQEEHQHSQEDGCYDEEGNLICELPEHVHDDACFSEVKTLSCGREESEGHRHSDACYKKVLACGKEAHTHSDGCYADDGDAEEPDEEAAAQASSVSMPEEAAGEMTAEAAAEETLSGDYVPELDPLNIEAVFGKKTGFYYFHADEGQEVPANSAEITDWLKVTEDTELAPTDLVKMYLPYSVPAGSLNETNPTARYRLPENIHLTDEQIDAINENENGIVAGYAESDPEYQLYLGAEAIEGDRTPDEILQDGAQEYISAVVRAVNVYENNEYIGQDLIFTFVPYSLEKNQIIYDEENNPISAGEKITGWFTCDFRMDQIDWVEEDTNEDIQEDEEIREKAQQETDQNSENDPAADSYSDSDPVDESENVSEDRSADQSAEDAAMNTVEKTAEVLFVSEDKDEDIEEIKRTLRLVEKKEDSVSDEEESETETPQFQSGTLTADGDGYKITLDYTEEAKIPENASLSVREITAETDKEAYEACLAQAQQHVNESGEARSTVDSMASRFFDIEIQVTDEEGIAQKIEPAAPVSVNIQISEIPADMSDADSEIESGETQNSDPTVLHFAEDGVEQVEAASESVSAESGSETASDDSNATEVRFEAESFSIYGVVYTVDFHWEVDGKTYEFSIPGGGFVSLQKLLEVLGVARNDAKGETANTVEEQGEPVLTLDDVSVSGETKKFVVDVKKVDFSRPELVWVEKVDDESTVGALKETNGLDVEYSKNLTEDQIEEINAQTVEAGDWALISMQPFTSEETLTVTMKDGEVFTILVTDAQIKKTVISASGETYEITVTYGEDAKLPDGAELAVREILPGEEEYEKDCVTADKALRAKYDRGLATHTVIFDISITADGEIVEPAEGSTVSVEIKLVESLLSDNEAGESENRTSTLDSQTESSKDISVEALDEEIKQSDETTEDTKTCFAVYKGVEYYADIEKNAPTVNLIHIAEEDAAEVIDIADEPRFEEGKLVLEFNTESFSDYIVTGSTSDGENYVFSSLPDTIYVGDTINIFNQNNDPNPQIYSINTNNGVVSVTEWDDNYYISGGRGKKARVIYAERTGYFQVNDKWIQVVNRPSGSHPETVSTVPNAEIGVTMNMFDYDLNSTLDDYFNQFNLVRQPFEQTFKNAGVNNGKTLKFWGSGINTDWYGGDDRASVSIDWSKNTYTTNDPGTGIVKNQLSGGTTGYPVLTGGNENLAYLFTDSNYNNDVRAYMGVDGLFQKDNEDYYYYDSSQNYAWLNPESKVFEVYGETYPQWSKGEIAAQGGYDNGKPIGFFPFHEWDPQHDRFVNWNKALNHHFGLNMEVQFAFPSGSMAPVDKNGKPIVFEFNGDDDMWVFIDGKLAMDIGGIHQPIDGKIDFTNRTVTVAGDTQTGYTSWDSLFDGKQHTLQVFYMERGGCDSNCKIKFNLSQYTDVELDKVDKKDPTKSLAGAKFQLFKEVQTIEGGQTVTKLEPVYWYKKQNPNDRQGVKTPYIAESDADGHVKFEGVSLGNYILKEIAAPPDYKLLTDVRSVPIYLTEENGSTVVKYSISGEDADAGREGVQIPNEKPVIDLFVEKTWLDVDGQPMDASDYSATFTLHRTKSWTEIVEEEGEPEKSSTLRIGYYYNDWGGTHYGYYDNQTYHYVIGSDASVQYNYNNSHNNQSYNWRRYRINQGGTEVQNIADNGTIPVTMPPEGETVTVYLYDNWRNGSTFSSLSANGQTPQNTVIQREIPHVDDPDDFTRTLTLANGATSGKFDSGLYTGTLYAGKFPYQETIEQPDGKKITYTYKYYITEEPISGFSSSPSEAGPSGEEDFTGEFVNRKLISVKIKKVWVDGTNEDGTLTDHGDSLTVTLSNGHEVTLNDANHWEATISNLPKYDREGNLIEYSWTEGTLPSGYYLSDTSVVEDGDVVTTTLTNSYSSHYMPEMDIEGTKIWDDNGDEQRPESITVKLYKNGEFYRQTTVLRPTQEGADPNQWPFRFTNVPVFNDDGTLAVYTVEEVLPEGYVTDYNVVIDAQTAQYEAGDATYKIINSYSPENRLDGNSVDLAFVVVRHGNDFVVWTPRPLQAGELNTIKDTVKGISNQFNQIMNATGDSLKIISGVPKNVTIKSGNKENVVVTASMKDGDLCIDFSDPSGQSDIVYGTIPYTYTQIGGEGGVTITNVKKTTSVSGTKTWVDGGREHNNANEITLKLSRTVKPVTADSEWSEVTVPETGTDVPTFAWDGNTYTYSYLPRYQDINDPATEYEYRVEETSVSVTEGEGDSQHTISYKQEADGNDFINTELTSVKANKTWRSGDTSINSTMRNASVTLKLQKKVGSSGSWEDVPAEAGILENPKTIAVEEADENAWSVTWDDLPKYSLVDGAVVAIQYQVVETEALISDTSVKPEADPIVSVTDGVADVINTLPETEISVTKQWKDGTTPEGGNDCIFDEEKTIQFTVYRKVGNNDPAVYEAYGDNGKGIVTYTPGEGSSVGTWQTVVVSGLPKYVYDESAQAWAEAAYYVVEEAIDGVTITYKKGSGTATGTAESAAVTDDDSEENRTITIINTDILVPVKILKVDETTAEGLSGAKFQLTRKLSGEGSFTKFVHSDFEEDPENDNKKTGPFTVSSVDGIVLEGLHPGEYRIEEKKAPDGYIISLQPFTFTVNADGSVSSTDADALLVLHLEKAGTDPEGFKIANEPGAALPNTGGSGTWLFTILGSILMIGAGVLLWRRRRME